MNSEFLFFVVKLNGKTIEVTPLQNMHTQVHINLDKNYLTEEDMFKYYSFKDRSSQLEAVAYTLRADYLEDEQEADRIEVELSQYSLSIQKKELSF